MFHNLGTNRKYWPVRSYVYDCYMIIKLKDQSTYAGIYLIQLYN